MDDRSFRLGDHCRYPLKQNMPADHPPKYWQAVANVLEGESAKAEVYVNHSLSLGVAREAILRNIVMDETPGPFSVKTGIIRESSSGDLVSRQCDLLIFDPNVDTPFYKMDEFVVIPSACARCVIACQPSFFREKLHDLFS